MNDEFVMLTVAGYGLRLATEEKPAIVSVLVVENVELMIVTNMGAAVLITTKLIVILALVTVQPEIVAIADPEPNEFWFVVTAVFTKEFCAAT